MPDYKNKTEEELLQEAKELCKQLLILLPTKVKCKSVTAPPNERMPFKVELFRTGQLYRVVDITKSSPPTSSSKSSHNIQKRNNPTELFSPRVTP